MLENKFVYILILLTIPLFAANVNDYSSECFSLINSKDPLNLSSSDSVIILTGVVRRGTLVNEFIKDSSKIGYRIRIENINGEYFWDILTRSYISKIEKWVCEEPFFRDRCYSGLTLIIKFYPEKDLSEAIISRKECENGFFILLNNGERYKYSLNDKGVIHLKRFFNELVSDIAKGMNECCD